MPQSLAQFGQTIKAKHPEYADLPDEEVANRVLAKYPQYKDMVQAEAFKPADSIGAATSDANPVTQFFQEAGQDLKQGGSRTGLGRALGFLQGRQNGFSGLNSGVSEGTGNFMGSPFTGTAKAAEGLASTPQHPIGGLMKALSGILEAGTIPSMVVGGPGSAAAIESLPSKKFAGQQLSQIAEAAGNAEVPLNNSLPALQRLAELNARGGSGSVPAGVMQLLERSQGIAPMIYPEARDFASNVSALSAAERLASKPQVLAQMGELRTGLHGDIANALGDLGPNYLEAIKEYARAQQAKRLLQQGGKAALGAAGAYGAYHAGSEALNAVRGMR